MLFRSRIERWRKIFLKLVSEFKFDPEILIEVPETRLEEIAYVSKTLKQAQDLLERAKVLTSSDWRNTIREIQGKVTTDDCKHNKFSVYRICRQCGFKIKENVPKSKEF